MKKIIQTITALVFTVNIHAQRTVPSAYPSTTEVNFIRTWDAVIPETDATKITTTATPDKFRMATQYIDGLGRPVQTVIKQGSLITGGTLTDLVSTNLYDEFGREAFKYLPSPANNTGSNTSITDGLFKLNPFQQQAAFYNNTNTNNPIKGQGETYFYSQTNFEPSPLSRMQESFAPGNSWVGTAANLTDSIRKSVKAKYYINSINDGVRIWNVTNNATLGNWGSYASPGIYSAGELYKNITVDENNKQVIEFKDKEGKVILKKVQLTATADGGTGRDHSGWLCTYYIYDDLNNLRCVIQPRGVELVYPTWALTDTTVLAEQCFRYEYDQRNRMIMKKVPGAGEVNMVYDKRDRLVMVQDGNMKTGTTKWLVTKYDVLNRPIETGLWTNAITAATHRTNAANLAGELYEYPNTSSGYELLTKTHYDDYTGVPAPLTGTLNITYITSPTFITDYNVTPYYAQRNNLQSSQVKGMVTWSQVKVLGTASQFISQVNFYDDKGRIIQVQSVNQTNPTSLASGIDITTTQYDFSGKMLRTHLLQQKSGTPAQTYQLATKNSYDVLGRIITIEKNINNAGYVVISSMEYDALGQMNKKTIGSKKDPATNQYYTTRQPLQELKYDYNIRGWLLGMNRDYLLTEGQTTDDKRFGFELGYDKVTNKMGRNFTGSGEFNGNIGGMAWKSDGDDTRRKYDFRYDPVNRLLKADFEQQNSNDHAWNSNQVDYKVKIGDGLDPALAYDANGNIKRMQQWGLKIGSSTQIDDMLYSYFTNTNKLQAVTEQGTGTIDHKLGDFTDKNTGTADYGYDVNGNMVTDLNKKISGTTGQLVSSGGAIVYNYLNLPQTIQVKKDDGSNKGSITYTYDAGGNKIRKVTVDSSITAKTITTTTTYINGFLYESKTTVPVNTPNDDYTDKLQFTGHEEGRIRKKEDGTFAYDYFIKDHLGNVRMVLTEEAPTIYYPAATLEGTFSPDTTTQANSMVNFEKGYYKIDNTKITAETSPSIPSWGVETAANTKLYYNNNSSPSSNVTPITPPNLSYPTGCTPTQTAGSNNLYKLNATTNKTGLEFMIKVMAGDNIDIFGKSYYLNTTTVTNANSSALDLLGLMTNMLLSPGNAAAAKGISIGQLNTMNTGLVPTNFFRGTNNETSTTVPKAYINYIFLDEQFKYTGGGASRVGASGSVKDHWQVDPQLQNITAPKNGYIFVYVSNESNFDVFFDNLQVIHKPGPILEETHYYPFGLTMAGISSRTANSLDNKYEFGGKEKQEKEFSDNSGLEAYDFGARMQDPQLGRWWQVDPLAHKFPWQSPYVVMDNDPINRIDPTGAAASPIYDQSGSLLGTDDQGLKGQALVLDKKDFQQGMKHEDAIKKDLGVGILKNDDARINLWNSYNSLKYRPDYKGFVTISEGVAWAKSHPNLGLNKTTQKYEKASADDNLYLDASKMDFGYLSNKDFKNGIGNVSDINLFKIGLVDFASNNSRYTTYALGRTQMTLLNANGSVRVENGTWNNYDWDNGGNPLREALIRGERIIKGLDVNVHGFPVKVYGVGQLNYTTHAPEMAFPLN